jgi:hypothetical protein
MDRYLEWLFIQEIGNHCEWAAMAYRNLQSFLAQGDVMGVFSAVYGFLSHTANISKLLKPPNRKYQRRGTDLMKALGVGPTSLVFNRDLRNVLEHYDERLEEWAASTKDNEQTNQVTRGCLTR